MEPQETERTDRTIPGEPDSERTAGRAAVGRPDSLAFLVIEVVGGPLDGERRRVAGPALSIGRALGNDLVLSQDRLVSSIHARIVRDDGGRCWLEDLGSLNGTLVDAEPVRGRAPLHRGSVVKVGSTRLEFLTV